MLSPTIRFIESRIRFLCVYIYIYIDSCNFVKLSPVTHISERSCEWKERERKEKNSTRRLRQRDFLRRSKKRETDLPLLLLLLLQGTGFVSRVQKKRGRRRRRGRTFAEERTREKRGDKEREGDVDIHRPGFWLDKERVRDTAGTHYDRWNTVLRVPPQSRPHPRNRRTCHSFVLNPGPFSNPRARATSSSNGIVSLPCIHPPPLTLISMLSLSLSLANLATRGAFGHESHLSGEYIHDGRALIGYPSVERLRPRRDDSSLRRLPDSRDLTLPDRRLLFHGGGPRIERDFVSRGSRAINRWTGVKFSVDDFR